MVDIKGPAWPEVVRLKEVLDKASIFRCIACDGVKPRNEASYVEAYQRRDPIMKDLVPKQNVASYVVCKDCARLPEEPLLFKIEQKLVDQGLLKSGLAPIDLPKGHSPGHRKGDRSLPDPSARRLPPEKRFNADDLLS